MISITRGKRRGLTAIEALTTEHSRRGTAVSNIHGKARLLNATRPYLEPMKHNERLWREFGKIDGIKHLKIGLRNDPGLGALMSQTSKTSL